MNIKLITKNKKAYFDYEVLQTYEAGIKFFGYEVKSVRMGYVNLKGSYISFVSGNPVIKDLHISVWKTLANKDSFEVQRDREIFLHKKDVFYLINKQKESGLTIIPLELYFKGSLIKVKVGLCKGKKEYDKKQILKEKTLDKEAKIYLKKVLI